MDHEQFDEPKDALDSVNTAISNVSDSIDNLAEQTSDRSEIQFELSAIDGHVDTIADRLEGLAIVSTNIHTALEGMSANIGMMAQAVMKLVLKQ